jgi:hypothetical protein
MGAGRGRVQITLAPYHHHHRTRPNRHFTINADIAGFAGLVVIWELGILESAFCRTLFCALC